jgi:hypothetical protein
MHPQELDVRREEPLFHRFLPQEVRTEVFLVII